MENQAIAILLAIYDAPKDWLIELLDSLNGQTYPNLCLYVRDDASPNLPFEELEHLVRTHITAFPFVLHRNEQNMGSNQTFAELVRDSEGDYIAFCDQDDVWLPNKLTNTLRLFRESTLSPTLVCTNVSVIDGKGNEIAASMEQHRRRHVYLRGNGLAPSLIHHNFAMGCTILMERARALSYLPFPAAVVHDHYLAFRAACDGAIDFLPEPQMRYRVYGGNQTGVMTGVHSKQDYLEKRICLFGARVRAFSEVADLPALQEAAAWHEARLQNFHRKKGGFRALRRMTHINRSTTLFELVALRMPAPIFRFAIRLVQKRVL